MKKLLLALFLFSVPANATIIGISGGDYLEISSANANFLRVDGTNDMDGQLTIKSSVTFEASAFSVAGSTFSIIDGKIGIGITTATVALDVVAKSNGKEEVAKFSVSDVVNSYLEITNLTSTPSRFLPAISGINGGDNRWGTFYESKVGDDLQDGQYYPAMEFVARNIVTSTEVLNVPIVSFSNNLYLKLTTWHDGMTKIGGDDWSSTNGDGAIKPNTMLDVIGSGSEDLLELIDDTVSRVKVLESGYVGISTGIPQAELDVNGDVIIQGSEFSVGTSTLAVTGGLVGILTDDPKAPLHIKQGLDALPSSIANGTGLIVSGSYPRISILTTNTKNSEVAFGDQSNEDVGTIGYNHPSDSFYFIANAGIVGRWDSTGLGIGAGIGTGDLDEKLVVEGNIRLTGSVISPPSTKTSSYTVVTTDYILLGDASSTGVAFTLPSAPTDGHTVYIKGIDVTFGVTILRNGKTIDGGTSDITVLANECYKLNYDGNANNWNIL